MPKNLTLVCVAAAALLLASVARPYARGVLPAGSGSNTSMTRKASTSCGHCHRVTDAITTTTVQPTDRVLRPGQTIAITVKAVSALKGTEGGFAADVTRGTLVAGSGQQVRPNGSGMAHANDKYRSWTFNYKAPGTPGLVEFYTVGFAADGNGSASKDSWSFHGHNPKAIDSTPVRFFVNAAGIKSLGTSCDDGYGNYSVLGAPNAAKLGSTTFSLEAHGLPPAAQAMLWLSGGGGVVPVDLELFGAPGCFLYTKLHFQLGLTTSTGTARRSEGRIILTTGIPNDPKFKGMVVNAQIAAIDSLPKRSFAVVTTNGIEFTVQ